MDPLSTTASIIAVLGAAEKVTKGLQRLYELKEAQKDSESCCNEIAALKAVCYQIDFIQRQWHTKSSAQRPTDDIRELLDASLVGARSSLLNFDVFLQHRILKPSQAVVGSPPQQRVMRHKWLLEKKRIEKLRTELRQARSDLFDIIELVDIDQSMRFEYQIEGLAMKAEVMATAQSDAHCRILGALDDSQHAIKNLDRTLRTQLKTLNDTIAEDVGKSLQRYQRSDASDEPPDRNSPGAHEPSVIVISTRPARPQSTSCQTEWCSCICHRPGKMGNSEALSHLFGRLHVKFSDIPMLTPLCDVKACRKRRRLPYLRINYFFPRWLLGRMLTTTVVYSQRDGIDVHRLRALRVVPVGAPIFTMAQHGNVQGIKFLFTHGQASPYDVDNNGFSALWFTLDTPTPSMLELCKLILAEGADPHEHVTSKSEYLSSFETAWELILGKVVDDNAAQTLKLMFNDPDRLNELYFPKYHRRVLGLPDCEHEDLDEIAEQDIDAFDAMGRTALHWSVLRNDIAALRVLLRNGANPNKAAERSGWTSMHFAARARSLDPEVLRLLLDHNVDIDSRDCHLQTPLSRAIRHGVDSTRLIIDAGADVNLQYDDLGWSALHLAVFIGQAACIVVLLEAGADPLLLTSSGSNAIAFAQKYGTMEVLEVLDRLRTLVRPAFRQLGLGFSRRNLERFRREKSVEPVTDEWWALWVNLTDSLCDQSSVTQGTSQESTDDVKNDSNESDDEVEFEDALEILDGTTHS